MMSLSILNCGGAAVPGSGGQAATPAGSSRAVKASMELPGPWWFRQDTSAGSTAGAPGIDQWMRATVPGCVHTDLLANGKIGDPFHGQNEKDEQWIGESAWEYKTAFSADSALLARDRVDLVWKGLDTYADVFLNGHLLLRANNMFRTWRVDVKSLLQAGENALLVRLRSPIEEVKARYDALGYVLPAANDQATPMVSMFTRKAPYHYGWDWGPRFVTSGIWRPVSLESWDQARIDDLQVLQTSLTDERAELEVRTTVVATRSERALLKVSVAGTPSAVEVEAVLAPGPNVVRAKLTLERPQRWWPNGLGPARLYRVEAGLSVEGAPRDTREARIGLRTLEVVHQADAGGKSFTLRVNGAPVFMKGANYIPSDSFPSRVNGDRYRWLVQSAAEANMNMLRVWGGGIYEDDRFYELCDELGILVWQDFMFACSMYPTDGAFLENVRHEAIENVTRLRNHPSLALWAGNNEMEAAWKKWGWQTKFHLSDAAQEEIWSGYRRIFHQLLPKVVSEYDPGRFYTRSSPSANDDSIPPDTQGYGDMHYWGVWHAEEPYTKYADHVSRFMSEYGFQSFPELATVSRYADPSDFRVDSPVMLAHQRHPRGNELVRTYMERDFRTPKDFDSFLYVSQVLQATVVQYAAETHRRRMPYNAGSLYWQLDDCWPVASWSGIDYFGRWKALHYFARRFFSPVLSSTVEQGGTLRVYVVTDRREDTAAHLAIRLIDFDGREIWRKEMDARLPGNTSEPYFSIGEDEALHGADRRRVVLVADVLEGTKRLSRSLYYFAKAKDLALDDPEISTEIVPGAGGEGRPVVRVSARRLARDVRLAAGAEGGMFSDNYFDLLPGEPVSVEWRGAALPKVDATSLRDSY